MLRGGCLTAEHCTGNCRNTPGGWCGAMSQAVDANPLSLERAWDLLRACARLAREPTVPPAVALRDGVPQPVDASHPAAVARFDGRAGWRAVPGLPPPIRDLLDLYLPVCSARPGYPVAVGHLGQSLDGCIATRDGDSCFVNGPENIVHLHRLRALCDAVVVGAATVRDDDPRLTARHVPGDSPLRVVIDPRRELDPSLGVFTDGAAATLVVCAHGAPAHRRLPARVEVMAVAADAGGHPDLVAVLEGLRARGCHGVFVEGGGVTVSRFLEAGLLDRLQIAVAPVFIGQGRAGVRLPPSASMRECLRPRHRIFRMGADVLFDCDLRADAEADPSGAGDVPPVWVP